METLQDLTPARVFSWSQRSLSHRGLRWLAGRIWETGMVKPTLWRFPKNSKWLVPPNHLNFNGAFHYKPSIILYLHFRKPPFIGCGRICNLCNLYGYLYYDVSWVSYQTNSQIGLHGKSNDTAEQTGNQSWTLQNMCSSTKKIEKWHQPSFTTIVGRTFPLWKDKSGTVPHDLHIPSTQERWICNSDRSRRIWMFSGSKRKAWRSLALLAERGEKTWGNLTFFPA